MTKGHPLHRKKSIHMKFRRTFRVRRLFYRVSNILDTIMAERKLPAHKVEVADSPHLQKGLGRGV